MNLDFRLAIGFPTHPKTRKLAHRLGDAAPWALVCLIAYVAGNKPEGDLSGMTDEDIELAAYWRGEPGKFTAALADIGFLDGAIGSRRMHDWSQHQPYVAGAGQRSEKARFAALVGKHGREKAERMFREERATSSENGSSELPEKQLVAESSSAKPQLVASSEQPFGQPLPSFLPSNPPSKPKPRAGAREAPVELPPWIPVETWTAYEKMRIKIRKPMTNDARVLTIRELGKLKDQGHDPKLVLEQSIQNSWQGIYELKSDRSSRTVAPERGVLRKGEYT